ncbi:MAG: carbohydrate ABC transporter permease [Phycisphaerales bacterium JB040]
MTPGRITSTKAPAASPVASGPRGVWLALTYAAAGVMVAIAVGPALWLVLGAFQPAGGDIGNPIGSLVSGVEVTTDKGDTVTRRLSTANVAEAVEGGRLTRPLINSVIVTLARAGLCVVLAALAAYPLAVMRFPGRRLIFLVILATTMIPEQVVVVPMFKITAGLGLFDSLAGAILPFSVSAFGVFLCRQAFLAIPPDLEEAARIDGAHAGHIWWHVMLPLASPTLATLALFSIIGAWSDLLWPLVILQSEDNFTLPVAINQMLGLFSTNPRVSYAASVLALVPIVVVFVAMRRFLKPELLGGAVKG